jgi:hypothetical protein
MVEVFPEEEVDSCVKKVDSCVRAFEKAGFALKRGPYTPFSNLIHSYPHCPVDKIYKKR